MSKEFLDITGLQHYHEGIKELINSGGAGDSLNVFHLQDLFDDAQEIYINDNTTNSKKNTAALALAWLQVASIALEGNNPKVNVKLTFKNFSKSYDFNKYDLLDITYTSTSVFKLINEHPVATPRKFKFYSQRFDRTTEIDITNASNSITFEFKCNGDLEDDNLTSRKYVNEIFKSKILNLEDIFNASTSVELEGSNVENFSEIPVYIAAFMTFPESTNNFTVKFKDIQDVQKYDMANYDYIFINDETLLTLKIPIQKYTDIYFGVMFNTAPQENNDSIKFKGFGVLTFVVKKIGENEIDFTFETQKLDNNA